MKQLLSLLFAFSFPSLLYAQGLSLPYYTGFDSPTERAGWQQFRLGVTNAFDWNDNGVLSHDYNVGGNSTETVIDWYVSPALHFAYPGTMSFKVITGGFSAPIPDNCEVWFGTNDPNPATGNFTLLANLSYMQPQYQWNDTSIAVPFVAENAYIAFKYKTIGAAWMTYSIDSIAVSEAVGVDEMAKKQNLEIKVFPNPVVDFTTVHFAQNIENAEVRIYTLNGVLVQKEIAFTGSELILKGEALIGGTYYVQVVKDSETIATARFVVLD